MQIVDQNYFQLFNLPESYNLDSRTLLAEYHKLQLEFHPDKYSNSPESEKMSALSSASYINDAYETLKSPLKRAGYVLTLRGKDIANVSQEDLSMELLMEQMQLRESLDDLTKDDSALPKLEALKDNVQVKISEKQSNFHEDVVKDDLPSAKRVFHELQFLFKLLSEIEESEEIRLGY